ncbi:hypothetical protein FLP10_06325 [Agromyces intestinalis]|uniref:Heparinase II/III-like C-terminal domain-containing protein n=1 Tax=Agromyces intestinalis TaxID=2592652 RepID=A0A5C1YDC1_9MICO|nr:heparinase II/III family protein [Agromyces intestinalis]QEO14081.1 hypothetical protein FLP10_06325 [Agromyces intestinalis]
MDAAPDAHPPFRGPLAAALERRAGIHRDDLRDELVRVLIAPDSALPVASALDRDTWDLERGAADRPALRAALRDAEAGAIEPWPQPLASAAARLHRDGDRTVWEAAAFGRQHRLSVAAIAAAATLDDRLVDEVADGVQLLCEQSSWCWPAHDDAFAVHGSVLADVTDPYLDLGAGDVLAQLAWVDHLLGAQLDRRYPGLRTRIRHEARVRVFDPFRRRRDWHWIGLDGDVHNWNPWIHGNVLVGALRLLDGDGDRDRRAELVALAIEGLDRYVAALPDDGAVDEGYGYWWNGACRALEALDVLAHATGGVLDATRDIPSLRATVAFPHRMHLGGGWYLNLADGQARPADALPWHALHRAARAVGDAAAQAHAASHRIPGEPAATPGQELGRLLRGVTDAAWLAARPGSPPLVRDVWLPSIEVLVARVAAGRVDGLTVAVKGGGNGEHHNHDDVGSFVVASDGVPVLVDAGRPTYTAATFGPGRAEIWTMQSAWHNVPWVRGSGQGTGPEFRAADVSARVGEASTSLALDLASAYLVADLRSWRREVRLERAPVAVRIEDRWELAPSTSGDEPRTAVRLLVAGDLDLDDGHARIVPLEGATPVVLTWPAGVPVVTETRDLDDPLLVEVWGHRLTRIEFDVTHRDAFSVTVELDLVNAKDDRDDR